jgi:hypothetical protein
MEGPMNSGHTSPTDGDRLVSLREALLETVVLLEEILASHDADHDGGMNARAGQLRQKLERGAHVYDPKTETGRFC